MDNWYWRSWEVCVGIVAACIPTLRPAYRVISSAVSSYLSHRSFRKSSDEALVEPGNPSKATSCFAKQHFDRGQASQDPALEAAAHTASVEADRAQAYGIGEDGFAMKNLPGDKKTTNGIQKTTKIDIEDRSAPGSQRSFFSDMESGERNRYFV